jgi:hypothetical protein
VKITNALPKGTMITTPADLINAQADLVFCERSQGKTPGIMVGNPYK